MGELHGLFLDFDFGYADNKEDRFGGWGVCVKQAKGKEEQQLTLFLWADETFSELCEWKIDWIQDSVIVYFPDLFYPVWIYSG